MSSTLNSLKVLSDPVRARLLHLIEPDELSVAEIQEVLGMGQSRISTHLAQLKRAGLVQASWSSDSGRRRRSYQLTPAGRHALDTERSTWRDFSAAVTTLLQPAPTHPNPVCLP